MNTRCQGKVHFARLLAHAGKDDLACGNSRGQGTAHLTFRYHVGTGAEARQGLQDGLIGIGFQGVADQRIHFGKGRGKDLVVPFDGGRRIAVEGGADRAGDIGNADVLGMENAVLVIEMIHEKSA